MCPKIKSLSYNASLIKLSSLVNKASSEWTFRLGGILIIRQIRRFIIDVSINVKTVFGISW
jgi:hypothetical protein